MFRLFKQGLFGSTAQGRINKEAIVTELAKVIETSETGQIGDLRKALRMIDQIELQYPGSLEYIRIPRGRIAGTLLDKIDSYSEHTSENRP